MAGKCMYCRSDLHGEHVIEVCERCGIGVWGEKMFQAIKKNMDDAREKGDL